MNTTTENVPATQAPAAPAPVNAPKQGKGKGKKQEAPAAAAPVTNPARDELAGEISLILSESIGKGAEVQLAAVRQAHQTMRDACPDVDSTPYFKDGKCINSEQWHAALTELRAKRASLGFQSLNREIGDFASNIKGATETVQYSVQSLVSGGLTATERRKVTVKPSKRSSAGFRT